MACTGFLYWTGSVGSVKICPIAPLRTWLSLSPQVGRSYAYVPVVVPVDEKNLHNDQEGLDGREAFCLTGCHTSCDALD